jgi:hypothetical protein
MEAWVRDPSKTFSTPAINAERPGDAAWRGEQHAALRDAVFGKLRSCRFGSGLISFDSHLAARHDWEGGRYGVLRRRIPCY